MGHVALMHQFKFSTQNIFFTEEFSFKDKKTVDTYCLMNYTEPLQTSSICLTRYDQSRVPEKRISIFLLLSVHKMYFAIGFSIPDNFHHILNNKKNLQWI